MGVLNPLKKLTNKFFDSLSKNAADRVLRQAEKQGFPDEVLAAMEMMKRNKEKIDNYIDTIPKAKTYDELDD